MYAILDENSSETTKKKSVNASIEFKEYYDTLFQEKIIFLSSIVFTISGTNYQHLLLS